VFFSGALHQNYNHVQYCQHLNSIKIYKYVRATRVMVSTDLENPGKVLELEKKAQDWKVLANQ
jgi:hypothetical protein